MQMNSNAENLVKIAGIVYQSEKFQANSNLSGSL